MVNDIAPSCLYCQADETTIPLIAVRYRQQSYWICPQHLPLLIHQPAKLASVLPGLEHTAGVRGHDHDE